MREKIKKIDGFLEKVTKGFNLAFFIVSLVVYIVLTASSIATRPFSAGLFWEAFNAMYSEFSFKVSCIVLIFFNGVGTLRGFSLQYNDWKESIGHVATLARVFRKKA